VKAGAILVRAPPMSGKTSLCTMFVRWCKANVPDSIVTHFSLIRCTEKTTDNQFLEQFFARTQYNFLDLCHHRNQFSPTTKRIFVMDETQCAYPAALNRLWSEVKDTLGTETHKRMCFFLFFAAYGEDVRFAGPGRVGTPLALGKAQMESLSLLCLRRDERAAFFHLYNSYHYANRIAPVPSGSLKFFL
jgi:hypothetical protein